MVLLSSFNENIHPCFSVHVGGAWLVAYRAEQRRRFKAVLSNEPVQEIVPDASLLRKRQSPELIQERAKKLDGFYLVRHSIDK